MSKYPQNIINIITYISARTDLGIPVTEVAYNMDTNSPEILISNDILPGIKVNLVGVVCGFTFTNMEKNQKRLPIS